MNVLLVDKEACFLDFALRCVAKGHVVRWFIAPRANGDRQKTGDGLGLRVSDYHTHLNWADIVLCSDNSIYMEQLVGYRDKGFPIMIGNSQAYRLELERTFGQAAFERAGLPVMPSDPFTNYDEAITHVMRTGKRYVSKPDGDKDKAYSYVSKSPRGMIAKLQRWKRLGKNMDFILQEFVPGVEMAVGGWFGPHGFNDYVLENFEFKKLMPGNLGCNTGEQGTVIRYVKQDESKLFKETLKKAEAELHRVSYLGYVDISVIVDEQGEARPLEWTMRFGWPALQIQQVLHREPVEFMAALLDGKDTFKPRREVAVGVVVTIPDFPYNHLTSKEVAGYPVWDFDDSNPYRDYLHPSGMMWATAANDKGKDEPCFVTAEDYVFIATGTGGTVESAKKAAYRAVESVEVGESVGYRIDIGDRLERELPILQRLGYARAFTWK